MILAIDTSQMIYSLATKDWYCEWEDVDTTVFDQLKSIQIETIDMILVNIGPGRFSGLRSGLAFAKGLARARDLPLVAISQFDLIADTVLETDYHIAIDARKNQAYLQSSDTTDIQLVSQASLSKLSNLYGNIQPCKIITTNAKSMIEYYLKHRPKASDILSIEPLYIRNSV